MASAPKIAANRCNAQRSTGPRTTAGKARTRYNAVQHGLNIPARYNPAIAGEIEALALRLSDDATEPGERDLALRAAEAEVDLLRVERAKVDLVNGLANRLALADASLPQTERAALAFLHKSKTLAAFDRYERRARSCRNRALRKLRALQQLRRRQASVEQVGPPRPRQRVTGRPFIENVFWLEIHPAVKAAIQSGTRLPSKDGSSTFRMPLKWGRAANPHRGEPHVWTCAVDLAGDHGLLVLINGEAVVHSFPLARVLTPVGGGKWLVQCAESGKLVRDLYWDEEQQRFRSRHALKLHYRSKRMPAWERHWERCQKLMDRIGATNYRDPPPRPKYMRRATYDWLCDEIFIEGLRMHRAYLGTRGFKEITTEIDSTLRLVGKNGH
jgi:hypothetical protein